MTKVNVDLLDTDNTNIKPTPHPINPKDLDGDGIDDDKEWFYDFIVLGLTIWAATMLTLSYIELPNHGQINKGDTTYVATILGGGLTKFGLDMKKKAKK